MKKALKSQEGLFPADTETAVVLKPTDGALNGPAPFVAAQESSILAWSSVGPVGGDHLDAVESQLSVEFVTVVDFVADDALRFSGTEHEAKEFLDESALMGTCRSSIHDQRLPLGIDEDHDLDALSCLCASDPIAAPFGFGKGSVNKAFVAKPMVPDLDI